MFVGSYQTNTRGARAIPDRRNMFPDVIPPASPREIISRVAAWHGLTYPDIVGRSRCRKIILARQDAMAATRFAFPKLSLPGLAKHFKRDHTTVLHHLRQVGAPTVLRGYANG